MSGKRFLPSVHRHTQLVAAAEWDIAHKLGGNGSEGVPIVDVLVIEGGVKQRIIPLEVRIIDGDNIKIVFSSALAGSATIIV